MKGFAFEAFKGECMKEIYMYMSMHMYTQREGTYTNMNITYTYLNWKSMPYKCTGYALLKKWNISIEYCPIFTIDLI